MKNINTDVLVIGAGIIGATQAIALAHAGINTCLVDLDDPKSKLNPNFDGRVSAHAS